MDLARNSIFLQTFIQCLSIEKRLLIPRPQQLLCITFLESAKRVHVPKQPHGLNLSQRNARRLGHKRRRRDNATDRVLSERRNYAEGAYRKI